MKSNVTMIAIALVVIVAVAGVAVFMLNNNGSSDVYEDVEESDLPVFGNANNDNTIDQKDIDLIKKMIAEEIPLKDYPFADANRDKVIDSKDLEIVEKVINGEKTTITFIDHYNLFKGSYRYVTIDYPLKDIVTQNADMLFLTVMIDADDQVAGYVASVESYKNQFYKVLNNGVSKQLGSTARQIAASDWRAIKDLDVELQSKGSKIGAIVVHSDSALGDYKDDILASGIPLIYLRCTDPIYTVDAAVLLGFLLGPDYAKKAAAYGEECSATVGYVQEKVSQIAKSDKKHFIALNMKVYVAEKGSQYTNIGIQAGGIDESGLEGTASTKLQDTEAITKYNNKIDYMLNCSTQDCVWVNPDELWELAEMRYLEKSTHFKDMVWINMSMPVPCRVMYAASIFYPDIVSRAEADDYLQTVVDKYLSYLNNTVEDGKFDVKEDMFTILTYNDYLEYKGEDVPTEKVVSDISALNVAKHFINNIDLSTFQGYPYSAEGDDQHAQAVPTSASSYILTVKLYNDAKSKFEETKNEYEAKIGTQSKMGGTYERIEFPSGLTDSIGYYVNTTNSDSIGSMYFAGYIKECYIEIHLAKKPSFSQQDLKNIVDALWGNGTDISAVEAAKKFDLNVLSKMDYAPYSVTSDSTSSFAKVACSKNDNNKDYYITYDSSSDALINFMTLKQKYEDKIGTDYMGGIAMAVEKNGFDDGYGFFGNTRSNFGMIQFVGVKDDCYVTIYIRMSNAEFTDELAKQIVSAAAASIA